MGSKEVSTQPQFTEDHPDIAISSAQEKADMLAFLDELGKRLPRFGKEARHIPSGQSGSVAWTREVGNYWRNVREAHNMSRYGLAARAGTHVNNIRLLEVGIIEVAEIVDFVRPYTQVIRDSDLYVKFSQKFGIELPTPPAV